MKLFQMLTAALLLVFANSSIGQTCTDTTDNRYVDCGDGTVVDNTTGLVWLKNANCFEQRNHVDAVEVVAELSSGQCGLTDNSQPGDWRLPTLQEWSNTIEAAVLLGCTGLWLENGEVPGKYPTLTDDTGSLCWREGYSSFTGLRVNYPVNSECLPWESVPNCTTADYWSSTFVGYDYDLPEVRSVYASINIDTGGALSHYETMENVVFVWPVRETISPPPVPLLSCAGFEPPMAHYPVTVKQNRALPLKAEVFDVDGVALTDVDFTAPPVIQVWFDPGEGGDAIDVSDDVLSVGQSDEGNQFVFTQVGKWQFNLSTRNYTASGTYMIFMDSGDDSEYVFEPTCTTEFMIK